MSATTAAWLVLAAPLAGMLIVAALFNRLPGRTAGWIGTAAIAISFVFALITLLKLQQQAPGQLDAAPDSALDTVGVPDVDNKTPSSRPADNKLAQSTQLEDSQDQNQQPQ